MRQHSLVIFAAYLGAMALGFSDKAAAAISIIGGADGPTSIFLAGKLQQTALMGPIAVAAYSYMSLVPIIQPPIMKLLTTEKERKIKMGQLRPVTQLEKILFPIIVTIVVCMILPTTAPLVGMLMLGNLFKESGVVRQLTETASNAMMYIVVILLGTSVGATTSARGILKCQHIEIVLLGLIAFAFGYRSRCPVWEKHDVCSHTWQGKSADRFSRSICRTYGSPCISESRSGSRSDQLPSDACNGTERSRCYRYSRSSRNIYGYFRSNVATGSAYLTVR